MVVDKDFESLFENLKLEDPMLPPRPWESIPSESGLSHTGTSTSQPSLYATSTVSEASLVRLSVNALHGVESSLVSIEKLCAAFSSDPADRTSHRIPSLWNQSLSSLALGKILKSIGYSGCGLFLLRKFVDYFTNLNLDETSRGNKQAKAESEEDQSYCDREGREHPPYSLVNQAFAVAVGKILEGYISALDTLSSSVGLRRSSKISDASSSSSSRVGCLSSVGHSEITLLEVYQHTKGLRTQIEALGYICNVQDVALCFSLSSIEDLRTKTKFSSFPRGGNLLTYLYTQLKVADPVHCALLKILFLRSCEPYFGFIRSWIFKAKISDPFSEFIVANADNLRSCSLHNTGMSIDFPSASIRGQHGVAAPCFLRDYLIPVFRVGQQLQVLMKLLELCDDVGIWNRTLEDILPYWSGMSSDCLSLAYPLTFNKEGIQNMVLARNRYYKILMEKLENRLTNIELRYPQVSPHCTVPTSVYNSERSLMVSFAADGRSVPSKKKRNQNLPVGTVDSHVSGTMAKFSFVEEPFESSECSSLNSSEDEEVYQSEKQIEIPHDTVRQDKKYLSALSFNLKNSFDISLQKPSQSEMICTMESNSCEASDKADLPGYFWHPHREGADLNDTLPLEIDRILSWMSEAQDPNDQHDLSRPLGDLLKSPFCVGKGSTDDIWLHVSGYRLKAGNINSGVEPKGTSCCRDLILAKDGLTEDASKKDQHPNGNSFSSKSWKVKYDPNFLCANPMVTKNYFVRLTSKLGERRYAEYTERIPFIDFTSIKDPFKVCVDRLAVSPRQQYGNELSVSAASAAFTMSNFHDKEGNSGDDVSIEKTKSSSVYSPLGLKANHQENVLLPNVSGGSGWEILLGRSGYTADVSAKEHRMSVAAVLELPLDFLIEKCLLEEIQLQYKYVSKLTIKLLEEGFNLQEHFRALRRYHLMESADWADLFIMSLWHHKWYVTEADKKISEIQGLLELSVQRSSCERDHNKDRLFVYLKEQGPVPFPTFGTGIRSLDVLGLGYRVDWPVSIVLTPGALKLYAEIFSFLIQVKLALSSLTEVWCSFKELKHLINQNRHSALYESEVCHFNILMKLRQQVNHFVTALQQYVQSQLSHVSWCKFLHSLKHKVKDMMDLESVHMDYLSDSLRICFLSIEMQPIASIVQSILQCALDFRSGLIQSTWETELDAGSLSKLSQINISQVLTIKEMFDKNLRELYLCYLKSPKNVEFGFLRFWEYLNYNEHYSEVIGKEMGHYTLF